MTTEEVAKLTSLSKGYFEIGRSTSTRTDPAVPTLATTSLGGTIEAADG